MMEVGTNFDSWPCRDSNDDMKSETKIGGVLAPLTATGSPLSSVSPAQLLPPPELQRRRPSPPRRYSPHCRRQVAFILFETCCSIPPSFGAEKSPDPSWKYVMIIALARLQFCRLLSAGKCPRGNGQIDSRVVVGLAVPKRELLQNDLGLGLEFEPREQESVIAQCSESLIIQLYLLVI